MTSLIVPCCGKSSRFPNMKPKWMLTHPDGKLMIEKSLEGLNLDSFDRIIITIVKYHDEAYEAELILEQVFADNPKIEICVLDDFTASASETVSLTIVKMKVTGSFMVKDSDNCVVFQMPNPIKNAIVGYNLSLHQDIHNIPAKSFLIIDKQKNIQDIIEKQIVSDIICLGVYIFESAEAFMKAYQNIAAHNFSGEIFISHVVSFMITNSGAQFTAIMADNYEDWGTLNEWKETQKRYRTYFIDVDGVILKNSGKYGRINWRNNQVLLEDNVKTIVDLQNRGAQIVITTSRTEEYRQSLQDILHSAGIYPYAILMGMHHAARIVINDFAPTNPFPSAMCISLPRNSCIKEYL